GKRIAQISRRTGAVTVPDLFRARYGSPMAGLICSLLIIVFMSIMMIAQFKAGATVMKEAWPIAASHPAAVHAAASAADGDSTTGESQGNKLSQWWVNKRGYLVGLLV